LKHIKKPGKVTGMKLEFTHDDCFHYLKADSVDVERVEKEAQGGKKLRIKLGIDPTSPNIHIGRAIAVWRLRAFQEMGHHIDLVIGDFTAQVGDTSDKDAERPMLTPEQVADFLKDYEKQLWMILNPEKKDQVTFSYNSTWLGKLTFAEVSHLADAFSVNQFIKRELIEKRLKNKQRVSLREMLYPLMQGYDSVMLKTDVELGGTDQWFNLLAGRVLQERLGQAPQAVITHPLIVGSDGRKMSSSYGNVISLNQEPFGMFTQMMQVNDDLLVEYLSFYPRSARPFEPEDLKQRLAAGENPRDCKLAMAHRMVELYFGEVAARECSDKWAKEATAQAQPEVIDEYALTESQYSLVSLIVAVGFAESNSESRRLIEQGGVRLNGAAHTDPRAIKSAEELHNQVLQVGKHRFARLIASHV
jgi:tyrosyl-tRNA synthetase